MILLWSLWKKLKIPVLLLIGTMFLGVAGYAWLFPDAPFNKLFFMTGITLSTVGYGDVLGVENNPGALWFTMILTLLGMGVVLYSISYLTAFIVEGNLLKIFDQEWAKLRGGRMKDHYIVCGAGQTGIHVVNELQATQQDFVVIDGNENLEASLRERFPKIVFLNSDATADLSLKQAGILSAKGLITTLSNDKDNLYLTITARLLNPKLKIVARAVDVDMVEKFKKAGADYVVSPNFIGGLRIASEILRPHVVTFLDKMLRNKDKSLRIEEFVIPCTSHWGCGKTLSELDMYKNTGVNIMAVANKGEDFNYNPSLECKVEEGTTLLYICNNQNRKRIESFFSNKASSKKAA